MPLAMQLRPVAILSLMTDHVMTKRCHKRQSSLNGNMKVETKSREPELSERAKTKIGGSEVQGATMVAMTCAWLSWRCP